MLSVDTVHSLDSTSSTVSTDHELVTSDTEITSTDHELVTSSTSADS
jgi:hypothetical protein